MKIGKYTIKIEKSKWYDCFFKIVISWEKKNKNENI